MRALAAISVSFLLAAAGLFIRHRSDTKPKRIWIAGAPQIEVGEILTRPDGSAWPRSPSRSIVIATSATCPACSVDRAFEGDLFRRAKTLELPVFFLLSSESNEDILARRLALEEKNVLRADLALIGVSRTPTILAVDSTGRVVAIRTGTISPAEEEQYLDELLVGTSKPLYLRIKNAEVMQHLTLGLKYQIIELRNNKTSLPAGLAYRQISVSELSIRAPHEITSDTMVFVDCNTAKSAMACQNALLSLSNIWAPDHLFAINLPTRGSLRDAAIVDSR